MKIINIWQKAKYLLLITKSLAILQKKKTNYLLHIVDNWLKTNWNSNRNVTLFHITISTQSQNGNKILKNKIVYFAN